MRVLVATDIASRGLDIDQLPFVVNYDLPNVPEDYIHRIGRTGRAGNKGMAVSLVCMEEKNLLDDIEKLLKQKIPKEILEGYEPNFDVFLGQKNKGKHKQRYFKKRKGSRTI